MRVIPYYNIMQIYFFIWRQYNTEIQDGQQVPNHLGFLRPRVLSQSPKRGHLRRKQHTTREVKMTPTATKTAMRTAVRVERDSLDSAVQLRRGLLH